MNKIEEAKEWYRKSLEEFKDNNVKKELTLLN